MRTKITLLTSILLIAVVLSGCAGAAYAQSETPAETTPAPVTRTISVNGTGKAFLTPDIAYITIGVHTEAAEATEAVASNNAQAQKVIDTLKSMGISEKDIQTSNFSIFPQPQYDSEGKPTGEVRYSVDNQVNVTVRDLDKIGDVLDAAVKAGANQIYGITFDVADKSAALSAARTAAVDDANAKAAELAAASGVQVGPVQTISEYTSYPAPVYAERGAMMADSAASVPISAGQMAITVDVSIVYAIE